MERSAFLHKLISLNASLPDILQGLRQYGWDSAEELVLLKRADIIAILKRYLNMQLSAKDIEDWANAIEGRDDIGYEKGHEKVLLSIIHELANPLITQPLTPHSAAAWIKKLG